LNAYIGEIAALLTSLVWSVTSTFFTFASVRLGSAVVNRTRLLMATLLLILVHWVMFGSLLPVDAGSDRWVWLGLSGAVGLVLGDAFLFQAFIWIGARLSMLMMSLVPVFATLIAWIFLGEHLSAMQIFGMALTLGGVAWVVMEKNGSPQSTKPNYRRGLIFGVGAAAGQAIGMVLAKNGMSGDFSPISANLIRMSVAMVVMWGITFVQGQARRTVNQLRTHPKATLLLTVGVATGPVLGVSLSLLALQKTAVGIASTLMSLPPVFLLPISYFVFKERFGWGAVAGTFVAVAGVSILFLV
jgi:drug/metabolite transporter (DMT)-like permease